MRLWHYQLLPYLPELQFKGQLRELMVIMRDLMDKGQTNHILINKVMEYGREDLYCYFAVYEREYWRRYGKTLLKQRNEFEEFFGDGVDEVCLLQLTYSHGIFNGWHNKEYLKICMANLYEKHLGVGKSRVTDDEWNRLLHGYRAITGDEYVL